VTDEPRTTHHVTPGGAKAGGISVSATVYAPPMVATASGIPPMVTVIPYHEVLLADAQRQADASQHKVAVILAQIAAEVYVEQAWTILLARKTAGPVEELVALVPDSTFRNNKAKRLWKALTDGDTITQPEELWRAWQAHLDLGNDVVHGRTDKPCGETEAATSIATVRRASSASSYCRCIGLRRSTTTSTPPRRMTPASSATPWRIAPPSGSSRTPPGRSTWATPSWPTLSPKTPT
jgi:prophage DNA circulation protein